MLPKYRELDHRGLPRRDWLSDVPSVTPGARLYAFAELNTRCGFPPLLSQRTSSACGPKDFPPVERTRACTSSNLKAPAAPQDQFGTHFITNPKINYRHQRFLPPQDHISSKGPPAREVDEAHRGYEAPATPSVHQFCNYSFLPSSVYHWIPTDFIIRAGLFGSIPSFGPCIDGNVAGVFGDPVS